MASRAPFRSKVETRVRELGGDDVIFGWIRDGKTMKWIGTQMGCSRDFVYEWMKWKPGRRDAFAQARKDSAPNLLEDGYEILENASQDELLSPGQASIAKEKAGFKKFMAAAWERGTVSEKTADVNLNVTINSLHLDALKAAGHMGLVPKEPPVELLPAEVVTD